DNAQVYCITGNIGGINDNNGNATVRICGNVTISGNISIKGNTQLLITDGSSLTVQGINMNDDGGIKGTVIVYTTGTLTVTGNFPANGTVTNHGTFNVNSDSYIYGTFTNNGTFHTKGTGYSTLNNNGPITNNGTMIYNGNLTENNTTTFINNCHLWVKRQFEINSLVNNYSYIEVDQNFRSNNNSTLNYYDGAMMYVKGNAAGPLNGDMNGNGTTSVVKITGGISSNSGADFNGNLEICASSYGTNSSNNIIQNGALKNGATAACDQAYIPTSACNPEGNGTPTVSDSDNDGVADESDLFPNDPLRAGESFYPSSNQMATLAFEDLWPAKGDYDFNDIVLDYQYRLITDADNNVKDLEVYYSLRAIGGTFRNGFGLQLEVAPSTISGVTRNVSFVSNNLAANGTETGQSKAVIMFFENAFDVLTNNGTKTVNTDHSEVTSQVDTNDLKITFTNAVGPNSLGSFPYNPFIFTNKDRTREVHLSGKEPTDRANVSFFGQVDDDTDAGEGRYYVTTSNLPWAINITQQFNYPVEKQDIVQAYLKFADWAQSGGNNFADWYLDSPGYRDGNRIY
ncbi:MAG: LruC domain-containing protein, partial [Owenweeksia sp.]